MNYAQAKKLLEGCGQDHVLAYWKKLSKKEQDALLGQIAKIDPKKAPGKDRLFEFCARAGRPSDAARYAKEVVADAAAFPTGVVRRAAVALALEAAGEPRSPT